MSRAKSLFFNKFCYSAPCLCVHTVQKKESTKIDNIICILCVLFVWYFS